MKITYKRNRWKDVAGEGPHKSQWIIPKGFVQNSLDWIKGRQQALAIWQLLHMDSSLFALLLNISLFFFKSSIPKPLMQTTSVALQNLVENRASSSLGFKTYRPPLLLPGAIHCFGFHVLYHKSIGIKFNNTWVVRSKLTNK